MPEPKHLSLPESGTPDAETLRTAIDALAAGQAVILPTETVYGLAFRADAAGAANGHSRPRKRARDNGADEDAVPTAAWTSRQRGAALGALGSMRELNVAGLQLGVLSQIC